MPTMPSRGVRTPGGAEPAGPTERADRACQLFAPSDDRHTKAPAVAVEKTRREPGRCLLLLRQLVRGHHFDRRPRQDAFVAVFAVAQQHLTKGQVVVDRRDQPRAAGREGGCTAPFALGWVVNLELPGLGLRPVAGCKAVDLR